MLLHPRTYDIPATTNIIFIFHILYIYELQIKIKYNIYVIILDFNSN